MTDERRGGQFGRAEFESMVLPQLEAMARLARFLLRGNRADAEDLVHDVVLRAFGAFPRFQPGTNLRAWLFRILRNTYVDHLRRHGREGRLLDREVEAPEAGPAVEEFRAEARRERSAADLEAALDRLPAELRMVLLLVDGEGMRYEEVAQVMECPIGTVRSRLHRGRRLLRQQLLAIWRGPTSGRTAFAPIIVRGKEDSGMRTIQLKVPTIKCDGCVEKIRGALSKRRGVQTVEGDPDRKEITVTFNPDQLGDGEIRIAVADAGFLVG
jgi:RNA polymerase sigma-70 factor (ECF subfamily)